MHQVAVLLQSRSYSQVAAFGSPDAWPAAVLAGLLGLLLVFAWACKIAGPLRAAALTLLRLLHLYAAMVFNSLGVGMT